MTDLGDWGTEDTQYDVAEFYTSATDGRGHSSKLSLSMPPDLHGEIAALVASGVIPEYATPQDVIRDAVVHRLRWLTEHLADPMLAERLVEATRRHLMVQRSLDYQRLQEEVESIVARTIEMCENGIRVGDWVGVKFVLVDFREFALASREPWSSKMLEVYQHFMPRVEAGLAEDDLQAQRVSDIIPQDFVVD